MNCNGQNILRVIFIWIFHEVTFTYHCGVGCLPMMCQESLADAGLSWSESHLKKNIIDFKLSCSITNSH